MDFEWIKWAIGIVLMIIGYFLKDVFNRFNDLNEKVENSIRKFSEENGKLKGRIELLEQKVPSEISNLEKIVEVRLTQFKEDITDIKNSVAHLDKTINAIAKSIVELFNGKEHK